MYQVPTVVCLKRQNGHEVQGCTLYIGRECKRGGWNLEQSKWANPYRINTCESIQDCLKKYETHVRSSLVLMSSLRELSGHVLGCWCKKKSKDPCHGDVLVLLFMEKYKNQLIKNDVNEKSKNKQASILPFLRS